MSTTVGSQDPTAKVMDCRQETADRSLREMLSDAPREITFVVTPEFYAALEQLSHDTRQDLGEVFTKAVALYKTTVDFKREGKHVGVVDDLDKLEREFVGLGSPGSGL